MRHSTCPRPAMSASAPGWLRRCAERCRRLQMLAVHPPTIHCDIARNGVACNRSVPPLRRSIILRDGKAGRAASSAANPVNVPDSSAPARPEKRERTNPGRTSHRQPDSHSGVPARPQSKSIPSGLHTNGRRLQPPGPQATSIGERNEPSDLHARCRIRRRIDPPLDSTDPPHGSGARTALRACRSRPGSHLGRRCRRTEASSTGRSPQHPCRSSLLRYRHHRAGRCLQPPGARRDGQTGLRPAGDES